MKKPSTCPKCLCHDSLSVKLEVRYELNWGRRREGFSIDDAISVPSEPDSDTKCHCGNCGWEGDFSELRVPTRRYIVTVEYDIDDTAKMNVYDAADRLRRLLNIGLKADRLEHYEGFAATYANLGT